MITYPPIYTPFAAAEFSVEAPVTEDTVRKLAQNANFLSKLAQIGQIRMIQPNIPGVPSISALQFKFCDGTAFTDLTSPLTGIGVDVINAPNLMDVYIRNAADDINNNTLGAATNDMTHNHEAATGSFCHPATNASGSDEDGLVTCHNHAISTDLPASEPIDPPYTTLAMFVKIN